MGRSVRFLHTSVPRAEGIRQVVGQSNLDSRVLNGVTEGLARDSGLQEAQRTRCTLWYSQETGTWRAMCHRTLTRKRAANALSRPQNVLAVECVRSTWIVLMDQLVSVRSVTIETSHKVIVCMMETQLPSPIPKGYRAQAYRAQAGTLPPSGTSI